MAPTDAAVMPARHERRMGEIVGARGKRANLRTDAPVLVNIGCGDVYHQRWINLDFAPRDPLVRRADCRKRLPFPDNSVDAVYHSHVFEHLDRDDGVRFLAENVRVLKPEGVLRVVVPDLEAIARYYLDSVDRMESGERSVETTHEWAILKLLDQLVRRRPAGFYFDFLKRVDLSAHPRVAEDLSTEMQEVVGARESARSAPTARWQAALRRARRIPARARREAAWAAVRVIAGRDAAQAFAEARFRASGEVHRWMYDRFSLRRAMRAAGLRDIALKSPAESAIPGFADDQLDTLDGAVRKPGSLFVEGRKG